MFDIKKTALNIKKGRIDSGFSQEQLAEASGISLGSIRKYESAEVDMGLRNACKIADALSINLDQLVVTTQER